MTTKRTSEPRTFFLNEQHELARGEKQGGGRSPKLGEIDWATKGKRVSRMLVSSRAQIEDSADPASKQHFFLVATPVASVPKLSADTRKAPTGTFAEPTNYSAEHSRVFRRLGMDLIDVNSAGVALVHATPERFDRLVATASNLAREGIQERARWATIDAFAPVPSAFRVDQHWLSTIKKGAVADVIIELQPLLSRAESADVIAAIAALLNRGANDALVGSGSDFSGRRWFRGRMLRETLRKIADGFFSVQSLHPPFASHVHAAVRNRARTAQQVSTTTPTPEDLANLPTVAVVDTGCPADHVELAPYRRGVGYRHPDAYAQYAGNHGSYVASRIVFGSLDFQQGIQPRPRGTCRFFDVMVATSDESIDDKAIAPALEAVVATAPDIRVFNLSFSDKQPLSTLSEIELRERLMLVQDLDNLIFARDVVVVFCAGNSPSGVVPTKNYPYHLDEPAWQLGAWPSGFNTLTCGAVVDAFHPDGLVKTKGWPSPLSRVGPGRADAPKPDFAASGGNLAEDWSWRASLGVWCCSAAGDWEDTAGTSYAAPLLAREAALAFQRLQSFCPPGSRPYGVTVKAVLALTAERATFPPPVELLAKRTVGHGSASAKRLSTPRADSALFVWQGIIEGPDDIVRVQLPIPKSWLTQAAEPSLRLVCAWDPPVNEAVRSIWACRKVKAQLRPSPGEPALRGTLGVHDSYPLIDRRYILKPEKLEKFDQTILADMWTLELSYEQTAEYAVGITFSPQQRVAFAAELIDESSAPLSPQAAVQLLPAATTMVRLSTTALPVPTPIVIRRA